MSKTIIFILFFILPNIFFGQDLIVDFVNQDENLTPTNVHTLVFKITNPFADAVLIKPLVKIPNDWVLSTKISNINLSSNETKICLITIQIPNNATKGNYDFDLSFVNEDESVLFSKSYFLHVNQVQKISFNPIEISDYVKAGDTIKGSFILKNEGNQTEEIFIEPSKRTFIYENNPIILDSGKSIIINTFQVTDVNQEKPSQNPTKISATIDTNLQPIFVTQYTNVIPIFQVNEDIWLRFPIKLSATYLGMQQFNGYKSGFQGEIHGRGSLNEKNSDFLEFRAVGPNRFGLTTFSQYEEYYINYETKNLYVHLGDKSFTSSFLTEFSRYGRGFEIRKRINKIEFGGFYNKPRFFQNILDEVNIYSKINPNANSQFQIGYLLKRNPNNNKTNLYYVSANRKFFNKINVKAEYALSNNENSNGKAMQVEAFGYFSRMNASVSYVYASPTFKGYFSNSEFLTANLNYQISTKLNLAVNYQKDARNFERDTLYGVAPYRENFQMGFRYNYIKNGSISMFSGIQEFEDRMDIKQFFYNEKFYRIEFFQQINRFTVNLQAFFAKTSNFLNDSFGKSSLYSTNLGYNTNRFSVNVNGTYSILNRYSTKDMEMFVFGGRMNAQIVNKWDLSFFYQNTYYLEENYADRNLFEAVVNHNLSSKQQLQLISRCALAKGQAAFKDYSFSVRYILNINAPIKKIKEYGTLQGVISNLGNSKIDGIKIKLGPYSTFSDENGNFIFKDVKPDTYFLELDYKSLNINDITDVNIPFKIKILEGENHFNFGITQAANVKGNINLDFVNQEDINEQSIIVELISETETFRKICDITKPFDFTYLKPGDWNLNIYRNGLDKKFQILTENMSFTLNPNQEKEVEIKISRKETEVKFLQKSMKVGFNNSKK